MRNKIIIFNSDHYLVKTALKVNTCATSWPTPVSMTMAHGLRLVTFLSSFVIAHGSQQCLRNTSFSSLLPSSSSPINYILNLTLPDPNAARVDVTQPISYSGSVTVAVKVEAATSCLVVNAGPLLTVTAAAVSNGKLNAAASISHDRVNEMAVLTLPINTLAVGTVVQLSMHFTTQVNRNAPRGLFLSPNAVLPPTPQPAPGTPALLPPSSAQWHTKASRRTTQSLAGA